MRLDGKDSDRTGAFTLATGDGSANKSLVGKPDGTLTWAGKDVITSAGGKLTGSIALAGGLAVYGTDTSNFIELKAGQTSTDGGRVTVIGKGHSNAGQVWLTASNGTTSKSLICKPGGSLTWDGKEVATIAASSKATNGYYKFANGLIIQWGKTNSTGTTSIDVTLPTPFTTTNYSVAVSNYYGSGANGAGTISYSTTGFKIGRFKDVNVCWIAIGY